MTKPANFVNEVIRIKREQLVESGLLENVDSLREQALAVRKPAKRHALSDALREPDRLNVIAEIKRASPSLSTIRPDIEPGEIARTYRNGGAIAISVLTEERFFRGSNLDLRAVRAEVGIPILRKDFILEPCQIYETAAAGADALSLISALLGDDALANLRRITEDELGMDAMIEVHTLSEMRRAHALGATLIGVNNRDLSTFEISIETSIELALKALPDTVMVSKGGLSTAKHLRALRALGYKGFVIGEFLLRAQRVDKALEDLLQAARH
jgi:indole-3-glycerol phosphate synthase